MTMINPGKPTSGNPYEGWRLSFVASLLIIQCGLAADLPITPSSSRAT